MTNPKGPEDFMKVFDNKLLEHLTSASLCYSSDSDGEGSTGPPGKKTDLNIYQQISDGRLYFKGFPECDYLRQVSCCFKQSHINRLSSFR